MYAVKSPTEFDTLKGKTWMVLGSSPSMPDFIDFVLHEVGIDIVATCNDGIFECLHQGFYPHFYGMMELDGPKYFGRYYAKAQQHGTKIVTSSMATERNDIQLGVEPDVVLPVVGWSDIKVFELGGYVAAGTTGGHLLQLAANSSPREVHLVGMEGYSSTPATQVIETFTGRRGGKHAAKHTSQFYGPLVQQVVFACLDVRFVFYGKMRYEVRGPNVRMVHECPGNSDQV